MIQYTFKEPLALKNAKKADPQVVGESLAQIKRDKGGRLRPRAVVTAAEAEDHPLHPFFEWNDAKAATSYRLDQARHLIRVVRVVDEEGDTKPAYFSIREKGGTSYADLQSVLESRDLQLEVRRCAKRDLDAFENRYRDLSEICDLIKPAQHKLSEQIDESRPSA